MGDLVTEALRGSRRALAHLITLVESGGQKAEAALRKLHPHTGNAHIVGVTGPPGSGKSTLINQLAKTLRGQGTTVGIVAVDASSPSSGGALLGDRIRMRDLAGDPGVFIRSMATRGHLGGLAGATWDAAKVLDAAGFEVVLIETVGAGQAEVDIACTAHTTVVIQAPGAGDDVQALKAGILEVADIIVVNKADLSGAGDTARTLRVVLGLSVGRHDAATKGGPWQRPLLKTNALDGTGVEGLARAIRRHREHLVAGGLWEQRERQRMADELASTVADLLVARLRAQIGDEAWAQWAERIAAREVDVYAAANALISDHDGGER